MLCIFALSFICLVFLFLTCFFFPSISFSHFLFFSFPLIFCFFLYLLSFFHSFYLFLLVLFLRIKGKGKFEWEVESKERKKHYIREMKKRKILKKFGREREKVFVWNWNSKWMEMLKCFCTCADLWVRASTTDETQVFISLLNWILVFFSCFCFLLFVSPFATVLTFCRCFRNLLVTHAFSCGVLRQKE